MTDLGFAPTNLATLKIKAGTQGALEQFDDFLSRIDRYQEIRDFPGVRGVSYLSIHNRFGTISIRHLVRKALERSTLGAKAWINELVWRDFYFQILYHFPEVTQTAFKSEYRDLPWENNQEYFDAWCEGRTGYPLVDAAMRQINQTGFMHNRLRMVVAFF